MVPGAKEAKTIERQIHAVGIKDVQLFFDNQIKMWAVCQVEKHGGILLPDNYNENGVKPYILWWCKNETGAFRVPNDTDFINVLKVVQQAPKIWAQGEKRADKFDAQDAEKDHKHREKLHDRVHEIAPAMKKALKKGNL